MKHLNSKVLAAVVACSAAVLLNVNIHAATVHTYRSSLADSAHSLTKTLPMNAKRTPLVTSSNLNGRHYIYQDLKLVRNGQPSVLRLGAHRGRQTNRRTVRKARRQLHRRNGYFNHQNRKVYRQSSNRTRRYHHQVRRLRRRVRTTRGNRNRRTSRRARKSNQFEAPRLINPHERIINQRKSAVNRFKKHVSYVKNQRPANFQSSGDYGNSDYERTGTPITGTTANGDSIAFRRLTFIPKKLGNNQFYSPQGLVVAGHYAYVITNATDSYETSRNKDTDRSKQVPASYVNGNQITGTSPYNVGASQIIRINLRRNVKDYNDNLKAAYRNIRVGPVFYGGHGQGLAYNPRTHQLWLLNNKQGQVTKTAVSLISPRTLLPQLRINFHFGNTTIGDDLAFARNGQALNVTEAGNDSFATPGSIKLFTGSITPRGIHMKLVKQALQWAPSDIIQGLTYNRRNDRLYILGDDSVTSVPVNKLGHLRTGDVWNTQFNTTREFEGLSFDSVGNGYLLASRSPEILMSKYNKSLHF